MNPIYLDHHSTTPVAPEVFEAMKPYFLEDFGNAANQHAYGWKTSQAVEKARKQIAGFLNAHPREIIFTSGATESNNLAILGAAESYKDKGQHIIVSSIEHKSVLDSCKELGSRGFNITYLPVNEWGQIKVDDVIEQIRSNTILVSIQFANNEIGTLQPISHIGKILRARNILFHTDAAQAVPYLKLDSQNLNVDLLSLSSHKMYGPKGIGALYIRTQSPRLSLKPQSFGGGQEKGLRSGTLNVPAIVGFGEACTVAEKNRDQDAERIKKLRDELENLFKSHLNVKINGHPQERLPHNLSVTFENISSMDNFLKKTQSVAFSTGAACTTAQIEPSHVLRSLGLSSEQANRTLRFGLGRNNTQLEIQKAAKTIIDADQKGWTIPGPEHIIEL